MSPNCVDCRFWHELIGYDEILGECRRWAPSSADVKPHAGRVHWPKTSDMDSCGDFEEREDDTPAGDGVSPVLVRLGLSLAETEAELKQAVSDCAEQATARTRAEERLAIARAGLELYAEEGSVRAISVLKMMNKVVDLRPTTPPIQLLRGQAWSKLTPVQRRAFVAPLRDLWPAVDRADGADQDCAASMLEALLEALAPAPAGGPTDAA